MTIQNHQEAYYQALVLAITAETEEQHKECVSMAESFAASLSDKQQKECQNKIESILKKGDFYTPQECENKVQLACGGTK